MALDPLPPHHGDKWGSNYSSGLPSDMTSDLVRREPVAPERDAVVVSRRGSRWLF